MSAPIGAMALSGPHKTLNCHMPLGRQPQRYFQPYTSTAVRAPSCHHLPGAALVPHASSGRTSSGSVSKPQQRSFSVMQSAMKIPGLASALHLIGVSSPNGASASGADSTVVAAGGSGTNSGGMPGPEEPPSPRTATPHPESSQPSPQQQQQGPPQDQLAAGGDGGRPSPAAVSAATTAEVLHELAAAAVAAANGNGNGYLPHQQYQQDLIQQQQLAAAQAQAQGVRHINGYANGVAHRREGTEEVLGVLDPLGSRTENNIMPYTGLGPGSSNSSSGSGSSYNLAAQIREIASTLRHINALRLEYLEKIEQQEFELAAKEQVLRSKEERIQSLEQEAAELRKSLALLHSVKVAVEAEVQRLRAAAAISGPAPAPALSGVTVAVAAAPAPAPSEPEAPPAPSAAAPHPLTSPPPAVVASAPVSVTTTTATSNPAPAPPSPPAPTPAATSAPPVQVPVAAPPPPRVPDIVLSYRSSWPEAFLHCNVEGRGWTAVPGLGMEHAGAKEYFVRVPGRSIEFVLNNGHGEWDSPGVGGIGRNYHIDTPGEYRLHYGVLTQVKPWQP